MEFYVMEAIKIKNENTATAVTVKEAEKEARMLFHQILAAAYANDNLESAVCEITNDFGGRVDIENWKAPEPGPEPEPEKTVTKRKASK